MNNDLCCNYYITQTLTSFPLWPAEKRFSELRNPTQGDRFRDTTVIF